MNVYLRPVMRRLGSAVILMAALTFGGCSVFQPVGDFFVQGYRNSVSYFNAYYNASRLFNAAVEEIEQAKRTQRASPSVVPAGVPAPTAPAIPATARQKLNSVIDKCSNILAFHTKSDLVDDALLMIARSYYLQGEYVKSERKCTELLAQYPGSDLTTEARILYGRVLADLSRSEEAEAALAAGLSEAQGQNDIPQQAFALEALSTLRRKQGDAAGALRYAKQLRAIAPDDESVASAMLSEAQLLVEQGQSEAALEPLTDIPDATEDPFLVFDAEMLRIEVLRRLGRFDEALAVAGALREDLRFKDRLGSISLEEARLLRDAGREDEAIAAYAFADTAYVRQASGADAAFELGELYEVRRNDYLTAARQYDRAGALGTFAITPQARRRAAMFTRYFQLHARLSLSDSLRSAALLMPPDSTGKRTNAEAIDTLTTQIAIAMQDLGEWFYSELERPDSSAWWLQRSLAMNRPHRTTPRGLYLLADLSRGDSSGSPSRRDSLLDRLLAEYPASPYAAEARKMLGMSEYVEQDPPAQLFREAEAAWEAGSYQRAADRFDSVATHYPASSLVAKSLFASAWMYDNRLNIPDSAAHRYQIVVQRFGATEYGEQARRRLPLLGSAGIDSTRASSKADPEIKERPAAKKPPRFRTDDEIIPEQKDSAKTRLIE
ncbi:MAG: tetratricopeptide repeat protein [Bacteroidetes bacterium]|jgi:outer membrane protein assembly factor BamD (BamD/ComL family)|nr:tetratricopeptide repeat protein [Bacteroidota bacterium]